MAMRALSPDLEARVWRAYFSRHVLPGVVGAWARRHYSGAVLGEVAERGRSMGRMWRAFVSSAEPEVFVRTPGAEYSDDE